MAWPLLGRGVREKVALPYSCRVAMATSAAGWPAAGFGALAIWVAGDFAATGSAWILGRPFVLLLTVATAIHLVAMGCATALGMPAWFAGVRAVNRAVDPAGRARPCSDDDLRAAVGAVAWLPVCDVLFTAMMSLAVVVGCESLEWWAAGPGSPNLWLIARSGFVACAIYLSAGLTLAELLVRPACRALRREAMRRRVPIENGFVLPRAWRVAAGVVPPIATLAVAVEIGRSAHATTTAYGVLLALSVLVAVILTWLQSEGSVRASNDVAAACRALAAGDEAALVTGSIDPALVAMAREFSAAAWRVGVDRRASSERYRALFDGAGDAILLVDPADGRIVEASARAERLFASPRDELLGRPFASWLDDRTARRLDEFALGRRQRTDLALVNAAIVRRDGTVVPVDASLTVVTAGGERVLQAILRDVRDRQRIEHELRRGARRLEELYRLAVVVGDDPRELAEHTVRALTALLECRIAVVSVLDGDEAVVLAADGTPEARRTARRALAGTPGAEVCARGTACVFTDVATRFPEAGDLVAAGVQTYCGVPIVDGAGVVVGLVSVLDVRPRTLRDEDMQLLASFARRLGRALERERLSTERDLLTQRLVESDRVKTEFLGMMSHELRTPLNIVVGYTRMLLEDIDDGAVMTAPSRREVLERMLGGGLHLGELVEDTLSVLRLEAGVVQVDPSPLALPDFFDELQGVDRLLRRPSAVVERWFVAPDVPTLVTDRRKLRQVVTNLVGNARKFTERGLIEVEATRNATTGGVRLTVRDTGCGIAASDLPFVFELYRQAASGRRHDGCGLGLYIVRRYVELLGGRVTCASTVGIGTTFVVELPATAAQAAVAA